MLNLAARAAADALYRVAELADRAAHGNDHGPWCEASAGWEAQTEDNLIIPVRISRDYLEHMGSSEGWAAHIERVFLRPGPDGTMSMYFKAAEEVDHISNRTVQTMVMAALDLVEALDSSPDPLPDEVVEKLVTFKRAARQRMNA
jgi:hypothetical protein